MKYHITPSVFTNALFWAFMVSGIVLCHFLFRSHYLYNWDAGNFALALTRFDVLNHQPHPPGYILFVAMARVLHVLIRDANQCYLVLNLVLQAASSWLVLRIGRSVFDERTGMRAAMLFAFCPLVLFNSNTTCAYMAESFGALLTVWTVLGWVQKGKWYGLFLAVAAFAFAGGIRQNLLILLMPLWMAGVGYGCYLHGVGLFRFFMACVGLMMAVLVWMVPLVASTGGWEPYASATAQLVTYHSQMTSSIMSGSVIALLKGIAKLVSWLLLLGLGLAVLPLGDLIVRRRRDPLQRAFWQNPMVWLFLLWTVPGALFYMLVHLPKPGYLLTFFGAFVLLSARGMTTGPKPLRQSWFTTICVAFLVAVFAMIPPQSWNKERGVWVRAYGRLLGQYGARSIRQTDIMVHDLLDAISTWGDARHTVIITTDSNPMRRWLRHVMYYLPQYPVFELAGIKARAGTISAFHAVGGQPCGKPFFVHESQHMFSQRTNAPPQVKADSETAIFVLADVDRLESTKPTRSVTTAQGQRLAIADLTGAGTVYCNGVHLSLHE